MGYCISRTRVRQQNKGMYYYLAAQEELVAALYNAALFRIRQNFTARGKECLSPNENQILSEIQLTCDTTHAKKPGAVISYGFLEKLMRITKNPDFFAGLSMQTAQQVLKRAVADFTNWLRSLKKYRKDPSGYLGKPKMPNYIKNGKRKTFVFTNQDCIIRDDGTLKFPLTKETLSVGSLKEDSRLKEVHVKYLNGAFEVLCIMEIPDPDRSVSCGSASAGIDFGIDNTAAFVSSNGLCLLYKGGPLKSANQWYNKQMAHLKSIAMKGHGVKEAAKLKLLHTKQMENLSRRRADFVRDTMHKISSDIILQCITNGIGTLVLGVNRFWKQKSNIGYVNNQNFVQLPLSLLRDMITYKALNAGITVVHQEESYTSKASLVDGDFIPVYGKENSIPQFSGHRVSRGMYRTSDGTIINADINGAGNILRKYNETVFADTKDWTFLTKIQVRNYPDLNKRIPITGIAAA